MLPKTRLALAAALAAALCAGSLRAAPLTDGLKQKGTPDMKSMGALAFGPDGVLFVGDAQGAAIFAIDTADTASGGNGAIKVDKINEKIAAMLGTSPKDIQINDLAVNPASGNAYLSVTRKGEKAASLLLKVDRKGEITEVPLKDVKYAKTTLPNASDKSRQEAITQLGFVNGKLIVAGMSNEDFESNLRLIPFPFAEADKGTGVKIYHGAHGQFETKAPVRTFVPFDIKGETHLLAAYQCTPLVKIPVSQLKPGGKVEGATIAELGNGNRPLDMIAYQKDGKDYLLIANSKRGMMKVTTENIDKVEGITAPVRGGGTAGLKYDTIKDLDGVEQMAKLDKDHALVLIRAKSGELNLNTVPLP